MEARSRWFVGYSSINSSKAERDGTVRYGRGGRGKEASGLHQEDQPLVADRRVERQKDRTIDQTQCSARARVGRVAYQSP